MICKLISTNSLVPDQKLTNDSEESRCLLIGRNRQCKIKDLKCSRNYCKVELLDESSKKLHVKFLKTGKTLQFKSGEFLKGPGFSYRIAFVDNTDQKQPKSQLNIQNFKSNDIEWNEFDNGKIIIGQLLGGGNDSSKIAGFDFDFTLVCTKTNKSFPTDENDWKLFDNRLPEYLNQLVNQGYRLVVISNQMGISKGKIDAQMVKNRFNNSLKKINIPCLVLIATQDDIYRKPRIGLWSYLLEKIQPNIKVDLKESFYVGDAAGRKKTSTRKADFSSSDLLFAVNIGLHFLLPEQFVDHMSSHSKFEYKFERTASNLSVLPEKFKFEKKYENYLLENRLSGKKYFEVGAALPKVAHCIIFCGISGSGKSTFYQNHLKPLNNHSYISMDELKSKSKCISLAMKSMSSKQNCIIDNTNIDKTSRMQWIDLCGQYSIVPLIFYFELPLKHIFHNNHFRQLTNLNKPVMDVVIYSQNKKFEHLSPEECSMQFNVNFIPKFQEKQHEHLYSLYLSDK